MVKKVVITILAGTLLVGCNNASSLEDHNRSPGAHGARFATLNSNVYQTRDQLYALLEHLELRIEKRGPECWQSLGNSGLVCEQTVSAWIVKPKVEKPCACNNDGPTKKGETE